MNGLARINKERDFANRRDEEIISLLGPDVKRIRRV
jgi:hypothetical protein